ncbi:hypothetical protein [Methanocaldococcus fervens]|uniref:Uncharacterized protein n=1 Tax=Methanocaldococcus fervens (strain DSM 4213 / JCM 15782 / AG86) TaxID=573064 RepID=C7P9Q3_METFA|nr:hypothetical protein [Methanocaldococcus fervens]ACV25410.1 hypothetical protein Mefer_1607 [Methanocaldococcus fervens AG86]
MAEINSTKVKVLARNIVRFTNMLDNNHIGKGAYRITIEALLNEIKHEISKLPK